VSQDIVKAKPSVRVMDYWAVSQLVAVAAGQKSDEKTKKKLHDELESVATSLAGPSPSPVEAMLADAAATSWFAFRMHEAHYAASRTSGEGMTIAQSEHSQRRIDRAHRRLLNSLKILATVRRLALPSLQINVARQQVNQLNTGG
jgi:hypothetical protein